VSIEAAEDRPATGPYAALRKHFALADDGRLLPKDSFRDDPRRRLALVTALTQALGARSRDLPSDPALAPLLADEQRRLATVVGLARRSAALERGLRGLGRKLYAYQREGVAAFLGRGRLLLADDMGLGKTTQAVASCVALWQAGALRRGLLVVPAALKYQWLDEWRRCSDVPVEIVEGSPEERDAIRRRTKSGFLIANYEQLLRDLDAVRRWQPEIVVLDEAQRIKNWATRTAASVKALDPDYRLVLTGTPFENRLDELASLLEWIDRPTLEPVWRLEPFHALDADGRRSGARHLDVLRERLAPVLVRRRRAEILRQLPSRTDTRIDVELSEAQRDEHDALTQPIAALVSITERRPLTQPEFLRLMSLLNTQRVIANGIGQLRFAEVWPGIRNTPADPTLLDGLAMPKLAELRQVIERIAVEQERKIVVFSQWRRALSLAHWASLDLLERHGLRAAFFTGKESGKQRTRSLVDFHDDPQTRILFATDAGGVGLNLQRAATCCVNFELPWNPAVLEQRVGRIHRLGQDQPIDVYNLVSTDCIEARIARLVGDKQALFKGLFDGDSNEVRFDGSAGFLNSVRRIVGGGPAEGAATAEAFDDVDRAMAERSATAVVAAADEAGDPSGEAAAAPAAAEVGALFAGLRIEHRADGSLRLEAPPETAATLAALLRGFADALASSAAGGGPDRG
jgi:SNF2 family DNA or RNA helicase